MYLFARAAITNYHKSSDLNDRNFLSHSSGVQKPKIKGLQGSFLVRTVREGSVPGLSLGLVDGHHLSSSHHLPLCLCTNFPFYEDTSHIGLVLDYHSIDLILT